MARLRFNVVDENGAAAEGVFISLSPYTLSAIETETRAWFLTRGWVKVKTVNYTLSYEATLTKAGYAPLVKTVATKPAIVTAGFTVERTGQWVAYTTHGLDAYTFSGGAATTSSSGLASIDIGSPSVSGRNEGYWGLNPYVPFVPWISFLQGNSFNAIIEEELYNLDIIPLIAKTIGPADYASDLGDMAGGLYSLFGGAVVTLIDPDGTEESLETAAYSGIGTPVNCKTLYPFTQVYNDPTGTGNVVRFVRPPGIYRFRVTTAEVSFAHSSQFDNTNNIVVLDSDKEVLSYCYHNDRAYFHVVDGSAANINGVTITDWVGGTTTTNASGLGSAYPHPPARYLQTLGTPPVGALTEDEKAVIEKTYPVTFTKTGYLPVTVNVTSDGNGFIPNTWGTHTDVIMQAVSDITFNCRRQRDADYIAAYPATLTVDGVAYPTDATGVLVIPLTAGAHGYSLAQTGCDSSGALTTTVSGTATIDVYTYEPMTATFHVTSGGSDVVGATITIDGVTHTTDASGLNTEFKLLAGTYTYFIQAASMAAVQDTVVMDKAPEAVDVVMVAGWATTFHVNASSGTPAHVQNALIEINGFNLYTDVNGEFAVGLANGTYPYTVSKLYYGDETGSAVVSSAAQTITVNMDPLALKVIVAVVDDDVPSSPVAGAAVEVGTETGTTDANGLVELDLPFSTTGYAYTVSKAGFADSTGTVVVNKSLTLNVVLAWNRWDLTVHVTKPSGDDLPNATVVLAGDETIITNVNGLAVFTDTHGGTWELVTSRAAYQTDTRDVTIDEADEAVDVELAFATTTILKSPCGLQMLDWIAPIYDNSTVALSILEALGVAWCQAKGWIKDIIDQRFVSEGTVDYPTLEWGLHYWEEVCNLPHGAADDLDQRRKNIMAILGGWGGMNACKMARAIARTLNTSVYIKEYTGPNTFTVYIPGTYDADKAAEIIRRKKPAHLSYVISSTTPAEGAYDCASIVEAPTPLTQTRYPRATTPTDGTGWTNPTFALTDDSNDASGVALSAGDQYYYNFGFDIPSGSTINRVTVEFKGRTSAHHDNWRLMVGVWAPPTWGDFITAPALEEADAVYTYTAGEGEEYGHGLLLDTINDNSAETGLLFLINPSYVEPMPPGNPTYYLNYLKVTVEYTPI